MAAQQAKRWWIRWIAPVSVEQVHRGSATLLILVERGQRQGLGQGALGISGADCHGMIAHDGSRMPHELDEIWHRFVLERGQRSGRGRDLFRPRQSVRDGRSIPKGLWEASRDLFEGKISQWQEPPDHGRNCIGTERNQLRDQRLRAFGRSREMVSFRSAPLLGSGRSLGPHM
jgi:hypothetical protein